MRRLAVHIFVYTLAVILGIVGVELLLFSRVRAQKRGLHARMAEHFVADLAASYRDPEALRAQTARLEQALVQMSVYDLAGNLVLSTVSPPIPPVGRDELDALDESHQVPRGELVFARPIEDDGRLAAIALVAFPQASALDIVLAIGGILAIIVLGALLLSRRLSRPLQRITLAAQRFGRGELSARAQLQRRDEIGAVGRAFDEMCDRVTRLMTAQQELMANVSHELRTPLSRIQVTVDLLTDGIAEKAQELLPEIAQDLVELERLIDDVMLVARLDLSRAGDSAAATPLRLASVYVDELLDRAAARFRAQHRSHELIVEVAPDLPELTADCVLLRRAIDNLVDNARKYSEPGRSIRVSAFAGGAGIIIEVADQGIGIDEADLDQVFTPFFRGDRSRSRATGGFGLGLVLARRVVEAHGGAIDVSSVPGASTTVRLELPAVEV